MHNKWNKRVILALLAVALVLTCLPMPWAYAQNAPMQGYGQFICCTARFNLESWRSFLVYSHPADFDYFGSDGEFDYDPSDEDGSDWDNDSYWLVDEYEASDIPGEHLFAITNYYYDEETTALWYKVEAAPGFELPTKMADNGFVWVFQNFAEVYADESWEEYSPDALIIDEEVRVEGQEPPPTVVSNSGITVSSNTVALTELELMEAEAPTAHYINRAVAYEMTLKTENGQYTDYADVAIPIPEGWDTAKLFGFVMEDNGEISVIPGTVTPVGTFEFTVPHFSEVGLLEATAVEQVINRTITFGKVQTSNQIPIEGQKLGVPGRYTTADGCVQYVVNHVTVEGVEYTYVTLSGLDVTDGTEIILDHISIVVIVKKQELNCTKLLASNGTAANSTTLDPLFDMGISGDHGLTYRIQSGEDLITLEGNVVSAQTGATGSAVVTAEVKHPTSGKTVCVVTYDVTVCPASVKGVLNVHVPAPDNGTPGKATISGVTGSIDQSVKTDPSIATVTLSSGVLTFSSMAESGITYAAVGDKLYVIHINPKAKDTTVKYLSFEIETLNNCTLYYAINGGPLIPVTGPSLIVDEQYAGGFNIMFFTRPDKGYITSDVTYDGIRNQYYSLVDGARYDGSESQAWPFKDINANYPEGSTLPGKDDKEKWKEVNGSLHGFRWALLEGNLTVAELRDLFARAKALGCDSTITFTRNASSEKFVKVLAFSAEAMPDFQKTITKIVRKDKPGEPEVFTDSNPYDPKKHAPLDLGDTVYYTFKVIPNSKNIRFNIKIDDPAIGFIKEDTVTTETKIYQDEGVYVIGQTDGVDDPAKIAQYADGEFTNTASLSYTYSSYAAAGSSTLEASSSAVCRISRIVTWKDNFGTVYSVQNVATNTALPTVPEPTKNGYSFGGWQLDDVTGLKKQDDGTYTVEFDDDVSSITIIGDFTPIQYTINADLDGGSMPYPATGNYTVESVITLPEPTKEGHTFLGWMVTAAEGNWQQDAVWPAGFVLMHKYGNVTLIAQWQVNQYTIIFKDDDATEIAAITQNYGTTVTPPADPTREGYDFKGWSPAVPATMPAENLTIIAQWEIKKYTVSYEANGGAALGNDAVPHGGSLTLKETTRSGYKFEGWFDNEACTGDPITELTNVTADTKLYAKWSALPYTVRFNTLGGPTVDSITAYIYEQVVLPTPNRWVSGMFDYWFIDQDGDNEYDDGERWYNADDTFTMSGEDVTFTAKWKPSDVRIGINMSYHTKGAQYRYYQSGVLQKTEEAYQRFPEEPSHLDVEALRAYYDSEGNWVLVDGDWNQALGKASNYINPDIFSVDGYITDYQDTGYDGLKDPDVYSNINTDGTKIKDNFKFDWDDSDKNDQAYKDLIKAWLTYCKAHESDYEDTDIPWDDVFPNLTGDSTEGLTVDDFKVVPYVIKRDNEGTWFVEMIILAKEKFELSYDLNMGDYSGATAIDPQWYGKGHSISVAANPGRITKTVGNVTCFGEFQYWWHDVDDDGVVDEGENTYPPNGIVTMPASHLTLKAHWKYYAPVTISQTGIATNDTAMYRITGTDVDFKIAITGSVDTAVVMLPVGGTYSVTALTEWTWNYSIKDGHAKTVTVMNLPAVNQNTVIFTYEPANTGWLHDEDHN